MLFGTDGRALFNTYLQCVHAHTYLEAQQQTYERSLAVFKILVREHYDQIALIKQFYAEGGFRSRVCSGCLFHCGVGAQTLPVDKCRENCEMHKFCGVCRVRLMKEDKDKCEARVRDLALKPRCPSCTK